SGQPHGEDAPIQRRQAEDGAEPDPISVRETVPGRGHYRRRGVRDGGDRLGGLGDEGAVRDHAHVAVAELERASLVDRELEGDEPRRIIASGLPRIADEGGSRAAVRAAAVGRKQVALRGGADAELREIDVTEQAGRDLAGRERGFDERDRHWSVR